MATYSTEQKQTGMQKKDLRIIDGRDRAQALYSMVSESKPISDRDWGRYFYQGERKRCLDWISW